MCTFQSIRVPQGRIKVGAIDTAALGPFLKKAQIKTDDFTLIDFIFACVTIIAKLAAYCLRTTTSDPISS